MYGFFHTELEKTDPDLFQSISNEGILIPDLDPADMDWVRPSIKTKVPSWFIDLIITKGWRYVNSSKRISLIKSMQPKD